MSEDIAAVLTAAAGVVFGIGLVGAVWVPPIVLGIRWARRKGVSPHWMWLGVHPLLGWIAFLVIRYGVSQRPTCPGCRALIPADARFCPHCRADVQAEAASDSHREPAFRWVIGSVTCLSCRAWVRLNASYCPRCSAPAPRLVCPVCESTDTRLTARQHALTGAIGAFLVSGSFMQLYAAEAERFSRTFRPGRVTGEMVLYMGMAVAMLIVSGVMVAGSFRAWRKRISCNRCGNSSAIPSLTPVVAMAPKEEP